VRSGHVTTSTVQVRTKSNQVRSGKSYHALSIQGRVKPDLFRPRQTKSGDEKVRSAQEMAGQVRTGQVRPRSGQAKIRSCQDKVRSDQVRSG